MPELNIGFKCRVCMYVRVVLIIYYECFVFKLRR